MAITKPRSAAPDPGLPPLRHGEGLDQPAFHARYEAMPEEFRAELIHGRVQLMSSPVRRGHGRTVSRICAWLEAFVDVSPGVEAATDITVILDAKNEAQPDALLYTLPSDGGHVKWAGEYVCGPPELVVEVSFATSAFDLSDKKRAYEKAGVEEYLVVLPEKEQVHWFVLREGSYQEAAAGADGILRSRVFPGLWMDPLALLSNDRSRFSKVARLGLASNEHQEWAGARPSDPGALTAPPQRHAGG